MVNGDSLSVVSLEIYGSITHLFAEIFQYLLRGALGFGCVNNFVFPVQDHASRTFQVQVVVLPPGKVYQSADLEIFPYHFQQLFFPLMPAVERGHRV